MINPFLVMQLASAAVSMAPQIEALFAGGITSLTPAKLAAELPTLEPLLEQFGAVISPATATEVHAVVGAIAAFAGRHMVEGVQHTLNLYLESEPGFTPIATDGLMGPATIAAIMLAQQKAGQKIDGWFGPKTAAATGHA